MSTLLITYDLNRESNSSDYSGLLTYIKKSSWARLSESSYAIATPLSPQQVFNNLKPYLDQNDFLLVITLKRPYAGIHQKAVIDWLENQLTH